jgi:hypothetical protein
MLFNNIIVISLLATIINGQCPVNWWPLSTSNSYLNDVINGKNINSINQVSTGGDRVLSSNNDAIYIRGRNVAAATAAAYTSFLSLPTDTYFCGNAFTISFWINTAQTTSVTAGKIARVIDFSDAIVKLNGIAVYLKPGTTATNAAVGLEIVATQSGGSPVTSTVIDSGVGFAAKTWTHVTITLSISASSITTLIYYNGVVQTTTGTITSLPASCPTMTTNFIGKGASPTVNDINLDAFLNDIKIFNSSLNASQVLNQYAAERCNFLIINDYFFL